MISPHRSGGVRHLIVHKGRLLFTRLTPLDEDDFVEAHVKGWIEAECQSSIRYMKRMGYQAEMPLDVIVFTTPSVQAALLADETGLSIGVSQSQLLCVTPRAAGEKLGFADVGSADDPFADVLHAVWGAAKTFPVSHVRYKDRDFDRAATLIPMAVRLGGFSALAVMVGMVLWYAASGGYYMYEASTYQDLQQAAQSDLRSLFANQGDDIPPELLAMSINLGEKLDRAVPDFRKYAVALNQVMRPYRDVRLDDISWTLTGNRDDLYGAFSVGHTPDSQAYEATINVEFPAFAGRFDQAVFQARTLEDALRKSPAHDRVDLQDAPVNFNPDQTLFGEVASRAEASSEGQPIPKATYKMEGSAQ